MKFQDKVVLITGASSGIGAATAVEFAREGAKVSLSGRNKVNLEKTAAKCHEAGLSLEDIFTVTGDIVRQEDCWRIVDNTVAHFGRLDILVNNAGSSIATPILDVSIEDMDVMMNVLFRGAFTITQRALPTIIKQKGSVVNVSSAVSLFPYSQNPAYSIAKAALDQYTKILALELAGKGVRVNSVHPGVIATALWGDLNGQEKLGHGMTAKEAMEEYCRMIHPNKTVGEPEEVAKAITFLASEDAAMITGAQLPIDGGWGLAGPQIEKTLPLAEV